MLRAGSEDHGERRDALARLVGAYIGPIRAFVASRRGVRADQVDDIVQDFLTLKWVERDFLNRVTPEKGRFRAYLVVALGRHVSSWLRDEGVGNPSSIHVLDEGRSTEVLPAHRFEVTWAREVISGSIERFSAECQALGRVDLWGVFEARVLGPILDGHAPLSYAALVTQFGFESPMQASNTLVTAKRAFARVLRATIMECEGEAADMDVEIAELLRMLALGVS